MDNKPVYRLNDSSTEQLSKLSVFQGVGKLAFVYKKTEKLATALYMITNFIKDGEPIKPQIREGALRLISVNISLCNSSPIEQVDLVKEYEASVVEVLSLCGIAKHVGFISDMNFNILKSEFDALLNMIVNEGGKLFNEEASVLSPSLFEVAPVSLSSDVKSESSNASQLNVLANKTEIKRAPVSISIKEKQSLVIKDKRTYGAVEEKKTGRRELILGLLKKKQGLNIKDFSRVISGCSEKTIQRELLGMVADGSLRKEGERRWSHYYTVAN